MRNQSWGSPAVSPLHADVSDTVLIVNAKARKGEEWFARAQRALAERGVRVDAAQDLKNPAELTDLVRMAIRNGVKRLLVGGGDGTFRSIVGLLISTDVTLGVLPLGTVNDLARNLGIEPNVERACDVIAAGHVERVDVGQANEDHFLLTASLGFSARSQVALTPQLKRLFGRFAYEIAGLVALHGMRPIMVTVTSNDQTETMAVLQAGAVNGHSWMGGALEIPGMDLEAGMLAFYSLPAQPFLSCLRVVRSLRLGQFFHEPGLRAFTAQEVTIETHRPHRLVLDGDLVGQTPVRLRLLPKVLKVFVPG